MNLSRRNVFKYLPGIFSSAVLTAFPALWLFPEQVHGDPVTAVVAVTSALSSLVSNRSSDEATKERLAALDLKLDQVLSNQIRLAQSIKTIQESIDELRKEVPEFLTAEQYRQMWEDADSLFTQITFLNNRSAPPGDKLDDFDRIFEKFYERVSAAKSRVQTTTTKEEGVLSMLDAGQAIVLYMDSAYLLANFDARLPPHSRWRHGHASKYGDLATMLKSVADTLVRERIPEALAAARAMQARNQEVTSKPPWGPVLKKMSSVGTASGVAIRFIVDECFRSADYQMPFLDGGTYLPAAQTVDLTLSFNANAADSWGEHNILFANIKVTPADNWTMQTWVKFNGGQMLNVLSWKGRQGLMAGSEDPCLMVVRDGNPDAIRPDALRSEFETFRDALARDASVTLNKKILEHIDGLARAISAETNTFESKIAQRASADRTFLDKILGLFE